MSTGSSWLGKHEDRLVPESIDHAAVGSDSRLVIEVVDWIMISSRLEQEAVDWFDGEEQPKNPSRQKTEQPRFQRSPTLEIHNS